MSKLMESENAMINQLKDDIKNEDGEDDMFAPSPDTVEADFNMLEIFFKNMGNHLVSKQLTHIENTFVDSDSETKALKLINNLVIKD